ncbi:MFS transporter [Lichenihabitans sp. Uapishka_5]|uniref:MFS transporter n=1 Tax=Lichenihabitans sp. Uapishka_5 TaxID=3037302 RepID=UPI0029E7E95C|nr:MFS transporter [Lichenihabitans sp. Uapishka_5]MDX7951688.1 MFS transporter [Lichenihabitans sp. Uapishka_5]
MQIGSALDAVNFSVAGAQEGFGPFLGVYLQQRGLSPATTGLAMGLAGLAGLLATTPIGAVVDRTTAKRMALAIAVCGIAVGAVLLVATRSIWVIAIAQGLIGVADTSIAPLLAALTLGIVGQDAYETRVSRNVAFNHAGNALNAALSGVLGYWFGLGFVAIAIGVMAVASTLAVLAIPASSIDHEQARGSADGETAKTTTWQAMRGSRPLIVLGLAVLLFEVANGAMLPFLAQARTSAGSNPSVATATMTVITQVTIIGAALGAAVLARHAGQGRVLAVSLVVVALRGGLAAFGTSWWLIVPVQVLEGVATGLASVAIPALASGIMAGSGHATAGLAGVMTAFGAGAALSPILAGAVAQWLGFPAAFVTMGVVAAAGAALWMVAGTRDTRQAA